MIKDFAHYVKQKVVNFCYDVKIIIKLMGTNLKENCLLCKK